MKKKHPVSSVIGDISCGINMRKKNRLDYAKMITDVYFTSTIKTTSLQKPAYVNTMGTKWIFKNKIDDMGNVTQNKAQLISQGYSSIKGVDFGETFTCSSLKGFEDPSYPDHVNKLKRSLYGLKQELQAWYRKLSVFSLEQGFSRGGTDKSMFIKKTNNEFLVAQGIVMQIEFDVLKVEKVLLVGVSFWGTI
ncbi:gag-pol polyprotein [Cucumis melo var. makuwa]|uniref:Gag-pol polyprotein n=1 Tax=Cucumis melo var. makuwa TaxID=1194695 RepID=A0A5A7V5K7_CUCMM|nr:gag-pol polyprotein [Cucumis melo var. makuwa]